MKKILSGVAFVAMLLTTGVSNAQVYDKGNVVFDVFYGAPYLYGAVVKDLYNGSNYYNNLKYSSIGPLGVTAEYLLSSKVGIGLEATYVSSTVKGSYYDGSNTYDYKGSFSKLRVLPRINIHFGSSDKFDPYLTFGFGYLNGKFTSSSNDPNGVAYDISYKSLVPMSYRVGFGVRYFFTKNIGLMAEGGFGGPLLRGGLALKF